MEANQVVLKEGETGSILYGVLEGEVELSVVFKDRELKTDVRYEESIVASYETLEKSIVIDSAGPGEVVGWSSLVRPKSLTSTVTTCEPTQIFMIFAEDLDKIFEAHPEAGYVFMRGLAEVISMRLRNRTKSLIEGWCAAFGAERV